MQVWETWGSPNLHILKKNQHFDAKSAQNLHILKKIKSFDSEKSPNLHILKKIKKKQKLIHLCQSVPHRVWNFWFFDSICRFGDFSLSKLLIFLSICRFGDVSLSKLLIFLSICRFGEPQVSNLHFCNLRMTWFCSIYFPLSISIYLNSKEKQIGIVLISWLIFDQIFVVIQNFDNIIILRILILWI